MVSKAVSTTESATCAIEVLPFVGLVEEHGVPRQAFPFVLLEQGVADVPNLLLCLLSSRIGLGFPM